MDASDLKGKTGLRRVVNAFTYSCKGLRAAWRQEAAFRQEITLAALMIPIACWLDLTGVERALLIASVALVVIVELLNSAIEAAIDRIGTERHKLSGQAKDLGSAAVLMALLVAGSVWAMILWDVYRDGRLF
ncbi:diacylglycerol kinase [Pseudomaricurvus sp. HS19]|uniref:diacylglycerol kinase n=1 Tax=Pseudomaricurvus sp. HS19 TaxID=2692626 RepID=UPI00351A43C2